MRRDEDEGIFRMALEFKVFKIRSRRDAYYGLWFWCFLRYDKTKANGPFDTAEKALEDALSNGNLLT